MRARLALAGLLVAGPASAATMLEHDINLDISGATVTRRERVVVALEEKGDLEGWSEYVIGIGPLAELVECVAEVLDASGAVVEAVPRRRHRRVESAGFGLYTTSWANLVPFPPLAIGQRLRVEVTTTEKTLYPATEITLLEGVPQRRLHVRVACDRPLRWHLSNPGEGITAQAVDGGLDLVASDLPRHDPPPRSPAMDLATPALHLSWSPGDDWTAIGRWYDGLVARLPRGDAAVAELARSLTEGKAGPRQKLEALAAHVQRAVRYEAVEIDEGGWVPTAASEVLARAWGDCKDKSNLLVELLSAAGIPANLVLVRAGGGGKVQRELATPFVFNHCIVGVKLEASELGGQDPVVDGVLLVDPTSTEEGLSWLPTSCQGRPVLLVDGERSRWLEVPDRFELENRALTVDGTLSTDGELRATAELSLSGSEARWWLAAFRSDPADRVLEAIASELNQLLPGCSLGQVRWGVLQLPVPGVRLSAEVTLPGVLRGEVGGEWLRLNAVTALPDLGALEEREVPFLVDAGMYLTRWVLRVPDQLCRPLPVQEGTDTDAGGVKVKVLTDAEGRLLVERLVQVRRSWVDPAGFAALRALAQAERRADRTRIRFECEQ